MSKMLNESGLPEQELPFIVKRLEKIDEMKRLLELRTLCYGHHMPEYLDMFKMPQECDFYDSTINIVVLDKQTNGLLGAIRTEVNTTHKLSLQDDIDVPQEFADGRLATASKLCIIPSDHCKLVKVALFKSFYMSLVLSQVNHVIIAARKQLEIFYKKNLCDFDLYVDNPYRKLSAMGDVEHRIYGMSVDALYQRWHDTPHPNKDFIFDTRHPDIML